MREPVPAARGAPFLVAGTGSVVRMFGCFLGRAEANIRSRDSAWRVSLYITVLRVDGAVLHQFKETGFRRNAPINLVGVRVDVQQDKRMDLLNAGAERM